MKNGVELVFSMVVARFKKNRSYKSSLHDPPHLPEYKKKWGNSITRQAAKHCHKHHHNVTQDDRTELRARAQKQGNKKKYG